MAKKYLDKKTGEYVTLEEWNRRNRMSFIDHTGVDESARASTPDFTPTPPKRETGLPSPTFTKTSTTSNTATKQVKMPSANDFIDHSRPEEIADNKPAPKRIEPLYTDLASGERVSLTEWNRRNISRKNIDHTGEDGDNRKDEVLGDTVTADELNRRRRDPSFYKSELKKLKDRKGTFDTAEDSYACRRRIHRGNLASLHTVY